MKKRTTLLNIVLILVGAAAGCCSENGVPNGERRLPREPSSAQVLAQLFQEIDNAPSVNRAEATVRQMVRGAFECESRVVIAYVDAGYVDGKFVSERIPHIRSLVFCTLVASHKEAAVTTNGSISEYSFAPPVDSGGIAFFETGIRADVVEEIHATSQRILSSPLISDVLAESWDGTCIISLTSVADGKSRCIHLVNAPVTTFLPSQDEPSAGDAEAMIRRTLSIAANLVRISRQDRTKSDGQN